MEGKRSRTYVMGILNATPDSFSDGGQHYSRGAVAAAVEHALAMARDGADIVDIGGESTRYGRKLRSRFVVTRVLFVDEQIMLLSMMLCSFCPLRGGIK